MKKFERLWSIAENLASNFNGRKERQNTPELKLVPGYHGPTEEIEFVHRIVTLIRSTGYRGKIKFIGSRSEGNWLSTVNYNRHCKKLSSNEYKYWYDLLNKAAKEKNLRASEMPSLVNFLPENAPPQVRNFLKPLSCPSSDFDLLIDKKLDDVRPLYFDEATGQSIDVHYPRSWG